MQQRQIEALGDDPQAIVHMVQLPLRRLSIPIQEVADQFPLNDIGKAVKVFAVNAATIDLFDQQLIPLPLYNDVNL